MNGDFVFGGRVLARADERMDHDMIKKLWKGFCLQDGQIRFTKGECGTFCLGDPELPVLPEGREYVLCVNEKGAAVVGKDYGSLVRGFFSLLMKIGRTENGFRIPSVTEESRYALQNRMIHICVFPENELCFIKKLIRLAGICQYTHIVIEFWGMLKYDCLKELAWPHAFTKEQARELIREARVMGMEPIPMFNQLGHATASRITSGKHVVLDQNPRLQYLFTPDGWAWDTESPRVRTLLKQVRGELYELFGQGEYMHVGCDEAYYYTNCDGKRAGLPAYLHDLTAEVEAEGRRPMIWMDMLLERGKYPNCTATCAPGEAESLIRSLSPSTVLVDWQYRAVEKPIPTLMHLAQYGHDLIGAPWLDKANYLAMADTVIENRLFGFMLTTWHTLKKQMSGILGCAKKLGAVTFPWSPHSKPLTETASILRRISFEGGGYEDCGWAKEQIEL